MSNGPWRHVLLLRELRVQAGMPTMRAMGERVGLSHQSVDNVLKGRHLARWDTVRAVAQAVTDDEKLLDQVWQEWKKDNSQNQVERGYGGGILPPHAEWIVVPADLHTALEALLAQHGFELRRVAAATWAAVQREP